MIRLLIEASEIMDDLFWRQAYGDDYEAWLDTLADGPERQFRRNQLWSLGPLGRTSARL